MVSGGKGSAGAWLSSVQRRAGMEGQERKGPRVRALDQCSAGL
nr:MAG TPA: hypothetical protein [Caudoviricetes sp.]